MPRWVATAAVALVALVAVALVVLLSFRAGDDRADMEFADVVAAAAGGELQRVEVDGDTLRVTLRDDERTYETRAPEGADVAALLQAEGATFGDGSAGTVELTYAGDRRDWNRVLLVVGIALGIAVLALGGYLRFAGRGDRAR